MRKLEKIILIAVIVVPILICYVVIRNIWKEDDENLDDTNNNSLIVDVSDPIIVSGDEIISGDGQVSTTGEEREIAGETYQTTLGDPISKIYLDATISVASANAYVTSNVTSEIIATLSKGTKIVAAQQFNEGWTIVNATDAAGVRFTGWIKTENISFPEEGSSTLGGVVGSKGTVNTTDTPLNVRLEPTTNATIITTLPKGAEVTIDQVSGSWYKISAETVTGWVSSSYIKIN